MRAKLFLFTLIVLTIVVPSAKAAVSGDASVVIGTADPAVDVPAIQAAVDQGGIVKLRGTFDFGDEGSVSVLKDVEIYGENAVIKNGKQTFAVGFDASLPDGGDARHQTGFVGPIVVFKELKFENALYSTIHVLATSGLRVEDCTFEDGKYYNYYGPVGGHFSIFISPAYAIWNDYSGVPSNVTGDIVIQNNRWEGNSRRDDENGYIPWFAGAPVLMNGILSPFVIISGKDVDVTVKDNQSNNAGWYHFTVVDIQGQDSAIEIINNTATNHGDSVVHNAVLLMSDMHMWTADMFPGLSEIEPGDPDVALVVKGNKAGFRGEVRNYTAAFIIGSINNAVIENNRFDITTNGPGCGGDAIGLQGVRDSTVRNNKIKIAQKDSCEPSGWSYGIGVYDGFGQTSDGNEVVHNKIRGSANYGIIIGDSEDLYGLTTENVFDKNDLRHLDLVEFEEDIAGRTYTEAHVLFDVQSANNIYYGNQGEKVLDFGTDNEYH